MKKIISMLAMLAMMLALSGGAMAENKLAGQAQDASTTVFYYDIEGERTNEGNFPNDGDAVVRVSKTIKSADVENEFLVTLNVQTTQDIRKISTTKADAATMLIIDASSSMTYCVECGSSSSRNHGSNTHVFKSRFAAAKENAVTLLNTFSALDKEHGGHRYMAIVAYDGSAYRVMDWLDVAVEANRATAADYIDKIDTGSGTNIEAGLMLGANVWNHSAVKDVGYKYTVLLSDGQPTRYVATQDTTSRDRIEAAGGNTSTNDNAVVDVPQEAARIKNLSGISRLYSIIIGSEADKVLSPVNMTVLNWLKSFSDHASSALNAQDMLKSFQTIISQIQLAAQAWKVDDVMGPYAVFMDDADPQGLINRYELTGSTLKWNVLGSDLKSASKIGDNGAHLEYELTYRVKLDNLNTQYKAGTWTDANKEALLTYAVLDNETGLWQMVDPVEFPVPQMKGYEGELAFTKVYIDNGLEVPIEGMTFELRAGDKSAAGATWTKTATSDEKGKVTFTGIPSGHSYTLAETNAGSQGFADPSDMTMTVALGEVSSELQGGTLVNTKTDKDVSIVVTKKFDGLPEGVRPENIVIEAKHDEHTHTAVLTAPNWTATLAGLKPDVEYTITEKGAEIDGYKMSVAAKIDGQNAAVNNAAVTKKLTLNEGESHHIYEVEFTNTYARKEGTAKILKSFWERTGVDANNKPILRPLESEHYANASVTITLESEKGEEISVNLPQDGKWEAKLDLPEGVYTILEKNPAEISDHEFIHVHLLVDGAEIEGNRVEITDGASIELELQNHYRHLVGQILVIKDFALEGGEQGETVAVPEDQEFTINVYAQWEQENGAYVPQGDPVATINVNRRESGDWLGTSAALSFGKYLLVEDTASTAIPGYSFKGAAFEDQVVEVKSHTQPVRAELTNTYAQSMGTITVTKLFDDNEATNAAKAQLSAINVLVKNAKNELVDTLTLSKDAIPAWTATTKVLPVGTYKLEEVVAENAENTAYVLHYTPVPTWSVENATVTLERDQQNVQATVTNKYTQHSGDVAVMKRVMSDYASDKQIAFSFKMTLGNTGLSGTYGDLTFTGGVAEFTLKDGEMKTVKGLPAGMMCTVEETAVDGFTTTVNGIATQTASNAVMGRGAGMFTFVNTRVNDQQLTISKRVDSALRSDYEKSFTFTISMSDESVKGEFDATINGEGKKVTFDGGKATVELKHGEAMTITGLPKGMSFRVSEQESDDFVSTATQSNDNVMDGVIGTDLTATFVNLRKGAAADLTVSKTVEGKNANPEDVFTFEVKIADLMDGQYGDMTFAGGVATVTLKHGQKAVAAGIPAGVAFTVTETDCGAYTPNVTEYTGTLSANGFEAAFVNTLELPELPNTGDKSSILLWGAMLAMAGAALVMMKRRDA